MPVSIIFTSSSISSISSHRSPLSGKHSQFGLSNGALAPLNAIAGDRYSAIAQLQIRGISAQRETGCADLTLATGLASGAACRLNSTG